MQQKYLVTCHVLTLMVNEIKKKVQCSESWSQRDNISSTLLVAKMVLDTSRGRK